MLAHECRPSRRNFLKIGAASPPAPPDFPRAATAFAQDRESWMIGPQKGYTPEIGTLVSMLAFTRMQVLQNVKGLSQTRSRLPSRRQSQHHRRAAHAPRRNRNVLRHKLFRRPEMGFPGPTKSKKSGHPHEPRRARRKAIKGNSLDYYLTALHESREKNLAEFKKRDDKWLTVVDTEMGMNNFAKWFHVAEHESNHGRPNQTSQGPSARRKTERCIIPLHSDPATKLARRPSPRRASLTSHTLSRFN